MQLFAAFAQKQNFGTGCDVISTNRRRVICNVTIGIICKVGQIIFTGH